MLPKRDPELEGLARLQVGDPDPRESTRMEERISNVDILYLRDGV